jgi:GNAT superfamily N-acetyltransferase
MNVRTADRFDTPDLIELLRHYRSATPWPRLADCDNETYIRTVLAHIFAGMGAIFVAEKAGTMIGMLIAIRNNNIWDPDLYVLDELAYWVEPEHRGSRAGYRLIRAYQQYAEELKTSGKIEAYTISKMASSPDLNYGRLGFEKSEEKWRI